VIELLACGAFAPMFDKYVPWIAGVALAAGVLWFFILLRMDKTRKRYRVIPHEMTAWGPYFVVVDVAGKIVAGPTFRKRMDEECAALNARSAGTRRQEP